ncbi:MAG: phage major capsid protein [Clostridia bacterium]|nr:phage major capsid protein [Clostridia bacterium]
MANIINRDNAVALIQEQLTADIMQEAPKQSTFMNLARRLPNMSSDKTRMRVLDMMPTAYWVDGDTGMKQTSNMAWDNVYINADELAVIVPIPDSVRDDAGVDLYGEIKPRVIEAIGKAVDEAVFFGVNRPASWQNDVITLARQAGNNVASTTASKDYFDFIMGDGGVIAKIEQFGYMPNGALGSMPLRSKLRGLRDTTGQPIFKTDMQGATRYSLDGEPLYFPDNGAFHSEIAQLIVGDFTKAVYAIRQDVTVKLLTEGVIQNPSTGAIEYNLAQQDMTALRVTFRMGWAIPNPATNLDGDRTGCPFAYLEPASPVTTRACTFVVKDNAGTPAAIADAVVDVNGSRIKTNASGNAVFNLRAGTYPYTVKKNGYISVNGTLTVASSAVTTNVTLIAKS